MIHPPHRTQPQKPNFSSCTTQPTTYNPTTNPPNTYMPSTPNPTTAPIAISTTTHLTTNPTYNPTNNPTEYQSSSTPISTTSSPNCCVPSTSSPTSEPTLEPSIFGVDSTRLTLTGIAIGDNGDNYKEQISTEMASIGILIYPFFYMAKFFNLGMHTAQI